MMRKAILAAALVLSACSGAKTGGQPDLEFKTIAPDVFAVVIDPNASVLKTEAAIRKYCAAEPVCTVLGWTDPGAAARSSPMTEREAAALALRYERNEPAGLDDMMWDCVRFPAAKAPCLSKS